MISVRKYSLNYAAIDSYFMSISSTLIVSISLILALLFLFDILS